MPLFKSVDLTSPGPIGSTTPNTGAFTTLSATPPANTTAFNSTGYSLTGTNAQTLLNLAGTWNTTGTPTGILLNITNTASNTASRLIDLKIGGTTKFAVEALAGAAFTITQYGFTLAGRTDFQDAVGLTSNGEYRIGGDVALARDAANVFAQRRTTNAQTFRLYNTFTDASNYERGFFRWNTNVLEIGAEAAGTGTQRQLRLPLGTVTASTPLSITQTWNSAGVTFTGLQLNATDTASASGSLLMDLQVGGASRLNIRKDGSIIVPNTSGQFPVLSWPVNGSIECGGLIRADSNIRISSGANLQINSGGVNTTGSYQFSASNATAAGDVVLVRDAADTFAQRRTTNAQTFRLYRTYTDASNYERLSLIATRTTRFAIAAENAGTGAARSLEISFYTSASDPASTDITDGCFSVWKNSGTGTIKLWANDGGTMKSVALA